MRRWRARNPEVARERQKAWRENNKEKIREKAREYRRRQYAANRERILATNKAWYLRNREGRREYERLRRVAKGNELRAKDRARSRARYAADPEAWQRYLKEWRRRNPEKAHGYVRASHSKRRSASQGETFTTAEWLALLEHHGRRCAYCGSNVKIEIDHRIPLIRGGPNTIDNILPACRHCNRRKHQRTEEEFRELLQRERRQGLEVGLDGRDGNAGTTRS